MVYSDRSGWDQLESVLKVMFSVVIVHIWKIYLTFVFYKIKRNYAYIKQKKKSLSVVGKISWPVVLEIKKLKFCISIKNESMQIKSQLLIYSDRSHWDLHESVV